MWRIMLIGTAAAAFFSSTFILNELMHSEGGHWFWSASLRYFFMVAFLALIIGIQGGVNRLKAIGQELIQHWQFWLVCGGIGFGAFYAFICISAVYAPGWVVAATFQFTVVASLFVLMLFGRHFPKRVWVFSGLVFIGVCLVNVADAGGFEAGGLNVAELKPMLLGGLAALGAAFCYPFGNQLVWEASQQQPSYHFLPRISAHLVNNTFNKVMLMSLGSVPFWLTLLVIIQPPIPSQTQVLNTFYVALFSGVIATTLFLFARSLADNSTQLAGVDATQAFEIIFALIGGMLLLHNPLPNLMATLGIMCIMLGIGLFALNPPKS